MADFTKKKAVSTNSHPKALRRIVQKAKTPASSRRAGEMCPDGVFYASWAGAGALL